ncbi:hypothetical protein Tco_0745130, partial [Tanacetum coccineum]
GIEGLVECKALASNLIRIQVKDIIKEVKDYLKTYSSAGMDISWYVEGIRCSSKESQSCNWEPIVDKFHKSVTTWKAKKLSYGGGHTLISVLSALDVDFSYKKELLNEIAVVIKDTAPSKAQQTLASAFFSEMVKDMKVYFDMTVRQNAVFKCLRAPHAQDFLLDISLDGLCQHMAPVKHRIILKYRLMILLFLVNAICPVCRKACLDSFGEHAVHCKELPGFKY